MVFSTGGDRCIHCMMQDSSITRAETVEVLDISDEDALKFLKKVLKAKGKTCDESEMKEFVNKAAGGRFSSLLILIEENFDVKGVMFTC